MTGYGGTRQVAAVPRAVRASPTTSSGGVTDLDRTFGGVGARIIMRVRAGGAAGDADARRRLRIAARAAAGLRQQQRRARRPAARRGRHHQQHRRLPAARMGMPLDALSLFARRALQRRALRFRRSLRHAQNPDDSGSATITTRARWSASSGTRPTTSTSTRTTARASRRRRSPSSPTATSARASISALQPASSTSAEIGLKALIGQQPARQRRGVRHRHVERDRHRRRDRRPHDVQERRPRRAAAASRRRGTAISATALPGTRPTRGCRRRSPSDATTGRAAAASCPPGARLPGVPAANALRRAVVVLPAARRGSMRRLEVQYAGKIYVNDRNTDAAPAYTIANLRVGFEQTRRALDVARIRAAQQLHQRELRRHGDRRRHQRPLFRAGRHAQFPAGVSVNAAF